MLRYLDPAEHYFWILDQVSSMNFVVIAELSQTLSPAKLEHALLQLQHQLSDPAILNLQVQSDASGRLFFESHQTPIILEHVVSNQTAPEAFTSVLAERFQLGQPLVRAFYWQHADQCGVALLFNHAIADGKTGIQILRDWLRLHFEIQQEITESVQPVRETLKANAPLHQLLPTYFNPLDSDALSVAPEQALANLLEQKKNNIRRFGKPEPLIFMKAETEASSQPSCIALDFSSTDTEQLQHACKARQCSVHGALMSAQLMALSTLMGAEHQTHCLTSPVDLRRFFQDQSHQLGMYTALLSASYRIEPQTEFWSLAQQATQEIQQQLKRGDANHFYHLTGTEQLAFLPEVMTAFKAQILKTAPQSLISNIGVLPDMAFDPVQQLSFALCPMPFQPIFTAVTCYKGRLRLNITYDKAVLSDEIARTLAARIKASLLKQSLLVEPA